MVGRGIYRGRAGRVATGETARGRVLFSGREGGFRCVSFGISSPGAAAGVGVAVAWSGPARPYGPLPPGWLVSRRARLYPGLEMVAPLGI